MPNLKNDCRETTTSVPINNLRHHHPRFQDSPTSHHTVATQSRSDHGHSIVRRKASTLSLSQMNNWWETSQPLIHLLLGPPLPLSQPVTPKSGNRRATEEATRGRSRNDGRRMKVREKVGEREREEKKRMGRKRGGEREEDEGGRQEGGSAVTPKRNPSSCEVRLRYGNYLLLPWNLILQWKSSSNYVKVRNKMIIFFVRSIRIWTINPRWSIFPTLLSPMWWLWYYSEIFVLVWFEYGIQQFYFESKFELRPKIIWRAN